jgi:hypothetical protein
MGVARRTSGSIAEEGRAFASAGRLRLEAGEGLPFAGFAAGFASMSS